MYKVCLLDPHADDACALDINMCLGPYTETLL